MALDEMLAGLTGGVGPSGVVVRVVSSSSKKVGKGTC